ncbi:hypothetical protein BaRGS_00012526, partial [Batillaria attramentaria]
AVKHILRVCPFRTVSHHIPMASAVPAEEHKHWTLPAILRFICSAQICTQQANGLRLRRV